MRTDASANEKKVTVRRTLTVLGRTGEPSEVANRLTIQLTNEDSEQRSGRVEDVDRVEKTEHY